MQFKKIMSVSMLVFLVLAAGNVIAETKIAYVETDRVLKNSPQLKVVQKKLEKEFSRREDKLDAEKKQLTKLEEKLLKNGGVMKEAERTRLQRDVISRRRKLKYSVEEFQEDASLRRNEELGKLSKKIAEVTVKVAKKNGYDVVLRSGVIWANKKVDITDKVIKALK